MGSITGAMSLNMKIPRACANTRHYEVTAILNNLQVSVILQHGWHSLAEAQRNYAANLAEASRRHSMPSGLNLGKPYPISRTDGHSAQVWL